MKICATCESDGRNGSKTGNSYGLDGSRTCDISYSDGSNGSNIGGEYVLSLVCMVKRVVDMGYRTEYMDYL